MLVPAYQLYCSICKKFFDTSTEWTSHLPKIDHQRRARLACRRWNTSTKECVLVAFASCPVADCDLAQRLSSSPGSLVSDFVWWKKKPNVGLLQFESKKRVDEILKNTNAEIHIGDSNRVQLKKAGDYLELEWNVLLSLKSDVRLEPETLDFNLEGVFANNIKKERFLEPAESDNVASNAQQSRLPNGGNDVTSEKRKKKKSKSPVSNEENAADIDQEIEPSSKKSRISSRKDDADATPKKTKKAKSKKCNEEGTASRKNKKKAKTSTLSEEDANVPAKKLKRTDLSDKQDVSIEVPRFIYTNSNEGRLEESTNTSTENLTSSTMASNTGNQNQADDVENLRINDCCNDVNILPKTVDECEENAETVNSQTVLNIPEPEIPCDNEAEIIDLVSDSDDDNIVIANIRYSNKADQVNKVVCNPKTVNSWKSSVSATLQQQYVAIFQNILIPHEKYDAAVNLTSMLENEFKKTIPGCKVIPFRHWYLGIKNCGNNELLLFVDYRRIWEQNEWNEKASYCEEKPPILSRFLGCPEKIFPEIQRLPKVMKNDKNQDNERFGVGFLHEPSGIKFRVICSIFVFHEVQTCELVKYLCEFDPIVLPLIGLVNYWANLNSLEFGNMKITNPSKPTISPLPASLDWLVLLFLINRKVIPSVRDILDRPHDKIIVCDKDIGFTKDPEFPKTWSSLITHPPDVKEQIERIRNTSDNTEYYGITNILVMLEILREFFAFYGRCKSTRSRQREVILNTKDGNIIEKATIMEGDKSSSESKALNKEEMKVLKEVKYITDHQVSMLHPIDLRFQLSFCGKKFSYMITHAMAHTSNKIQKLFGTLKKKTKENRRIDLITILNVNNIRKKCSMKGGREKRQKQTDRRRRLISTNHKQKKKKAMKKVKTKLKTASGKKKNVSS